LQVRVTFSAAGRGVLRVCDDGAAIPRSLAQQLFAGPVASQTGFGVGLYQAGRLARESRYRLYLETNEPGRVCFALEPLAAGEVANERHVA
jgi:sensor histidine kinase regulating citrate/malate metabolism